MSKLKLNKAIYSYDDILEASKAFTEICKTDIQCNGDYWIVYFEKCIADENVVSKEFENYLIDFIGVK